jgi:hypothetical protein
VGCPELRLDQGKGQGLGLERGKTTFLLPAHHLRDGQSEGHRRRVGMVPVCANKSRVSVNTKAWSGVSEFLNTTHGTYSDKCKPMTGANGTCLHAGTVCALGAP